ncbi:unnamed protein product [Sphagnum troendelagicum]|uniref:Uncharacterized protein n=1 Tax=Sphagnum troendelagicum TaxID=128251 RepID=A0ABP0TUW9_9BRYO
MASSSHDTRRASSDAPECIEEVFTMEPHYYKRLRPKSLPLKRVCTLQRYSEELSMSIDPEEQLLQKIRVVPVRKCWIHISTRLSEISQTEEM